MLICCITEITCMIGVVVGIKSLPITIFLLIFNVDAFMTAILERFKLKRPIQTFELVAMVGCYTGIVIIVSDTQSDP
jgi:hypothetical protein